MRRPAIRESGRRRYDRAYDRGVHRGGRAPHAQRGVTMVLVALAMIAIIAIAALSIDIVTLYLAREEAQRSADAAALAAARVLSISGITGTANPATEPASWVAICGGSASAATLTAQAVGIQNGVGSIAPTAVNVSYSAPGGAPNASCAGLGFEFAVNPIVTVQVTRATLPTFFSRIWGRAGNSVIAKATAEAFNPSNSGSVGPTDTITPVEPRCVKPWVVPNKDPLFPSPNCPPFGAGRCSPLVNLSDGTIAHPGISLGGAVGGSTGVIGETFWLVPDCHYSGSACGLRSNPAQANIAGTTHIQAPPNLEYLPGNVTGTSATASPNCPGGSSPSLYETVITGCDQSIHYQCGNHDANAVDLSENPATSHDTRNGVQCLIHQGNTNVSQPDGQDTLSPYAAPSAFPFQILAGTSTPLTGLAGKPITSSNSIVSLPIYDDSEKNLTSTGQTSVTFVGFLQVFINAVDQYGNINVTVLNVAGCSNNAAASPALGSSPVPIRLITPP